MNRRDFFQPGRLAQTAAQFLGEDVKPIKPEETGSGSPVLLCFGRKAMATTFEILLPFGTLQGTEAVNEALDLIDHLEDQLSVYRDHSEVSRLNARAGSEPVTLEKNLFDLLVLAREIHLETEGAFDISLGALIKAWGFYRRAGRVPSPEECEQALHQVGMKNMVLDSPRQSVTFLRPGLEINLGSIGKGYALDRAVQFLWREKKLSNFLVHGGYSSIFALGDEGGSEQGWQIGLTDPRNPRIQLGMFRLHNRAMGTSSATYQHLTHQGRRLGHILDPRTGWPAEGMLGTTVTAPTAAVADALATAFFILGPEKAKTYCQKHPEIGMVLLPNHPSRRPVVLGRALEEYIPKTGAPAASPS